MTGPEIVLHVAEPSDVAVVGKLARSVIRTSYAEAYPPGAIASFLEYHSDDAIIELICGRPMAPQATEYGRLRELVSRYMAAKGEFAFRLAGYLEDIGSVPFCDDKEFKALRFQSGPFGVECCRSPLMPPSK